MGLSTDRAAVHGAWTRMEKAARAGQMANTRVWGRRWRRWIAEANSADLLWAMWRMFQADVATTNARHLAPSPLDNETPTDAGMLAPSLFAETRKRYLSAWGDAAPGVKASDSHSRLALAAALVVYDALVRSGNIPALPRKRIPPRVKERLEQMVSAEGDLTGIWHAAACAALGEKGKAWAADQWWRWTALGTTPRRERGYGQEAWRFPSGLTAIGVASGCVAESWTDEAWRRLAFRIEKDGQAGARSRPYRVVLLLYALKTHTSEAPLTGASRAGGRAALVALLRSPRKQWPRWFDIVAYYPQWRKLWTTTSSRWLPDDCLQTLAQMVVAGMAEFPKKGRGTSKSRDKFNNVALMVEVLPKACLTPVAARKTSQALQSPAATPLAAALLRRADIGIPETLRLEAAGHADGSVRAAAILGL